MRRISATLVTLICSLNITWAQSDELVVQGASPDLYILHNTAARENYYSVGRLYNVAPREIAAYNNLVFENGLRLGQPVKIPLTQSNFMQSPASASADLAIPVYHIMEPKEGLYRVSVNYNKVPLEQLKKWNHLSSDAVGAGTKLIIGYLKVQNESELAKSTRSDQKKTDMPVNDQPSLTKNAGIPGATAAEVKTKDAVKTTDIAKNTPPPTSTAIPGARSAAATNTPVNFNGGAFKKLYDDQQGNKTPVTETGISGVFKSTSGWRDGKYYCFHNSAPPGTIVKISNTLNGKSIYAKVLDLIPDISQNAGLILHLSNAGAEELGITNARFDCSISYSK